MSADLSPLAECFIATVEFADDAGAERVAGFFSIISAAGMRGWRRGHRTAVLPDFQGMGIGNAMIEATAEWLYQTRGLRFRATVGAPAIVRHRRKRPDMWRLVSAPAQRPPSGNDGKAGRPTNKAGRFITSAGRLTTSWEYVPEALRKTPV